MTATAILTKTFAADSANLLFLIVVVCAIGLFGLGAIAALILWFWRLIDRLFPDPPEQ